MSLRESAKLDASAETVFVQTYGEDVPAGLPAAWRAEQERLGAMDAEARSLCRSFRDDESANFSRGLAFVKGYGLDPTAWDGVFLASEFQRLSPITRALAVAVRLGLQKQEPLLFRKFVRRWTEQWEATGRPVPNVSNGLGFIAWSFERALTASCGFDYLSTETCVQITVKAGLGEGARIEGPMTKLAAVLPASTRSTSLTPLQCGGGGDGPSWHPPSYGTVLPTTESAYLQATSLAAVGRIVLPEHFTCSDLFESSAFEDLRRKMKQHLFKSGALAIALGAAQIDERTPSGRRRQELLSTYHPLCRASEETRAQIFQSKRDATQSFLPVWLPWPDGYRDAHRDLAAKYPEITIFRR